MPVYKTHFTPSLAQSLPPRNQHPPPPHSPSPLFSTAAHSQPPRCLGVEVSCPGQLLLLPERWRDKPRSCVRNHVAVQRDEEQCKGMQSSPCSHIQSLLPALGGGGRGHGPAVQDAAVLLFPCSAYRLIRTIPLVSRSPRAILGHFSCCFSLPAVGRE